MQIIETVIKTFALIKENKDAKVKVVADPQFGVIRISGGGGTATIYTSEAESVANMVLNAEMWNRENGAGDDE
jgi:hypothetical protein